MKKLFFAFIINIGLVAGVLNSPVSAQDLVWVTVEGRALIENVSKEEARSRAIEDAMLTAVNKVVGASISAETLAVNLKLSGGLVGSIPYGRLTEKKIIEEGIVTVYNDGKARPEKVYKVKMKAGVLEETNGTDASF